MVYTWHKQRREIVLRKCAAMRAAKARKRIEFGSTMLDVGGIATDGIFGKHTVRILSYGDGGNHYAITVDGEHRQARTERGVLRCLARMVTGKTAIKKGSNER